MQVLKERALTGLLAVFLCTILVACQAAEDSAGSERPNVLLILIDDQGYGDLSYTGHPVIKTPNIDDLARESVRLTDFHVDPTCSATRAALLTGKYSHRAGVWHTIAAGNYLPRSETTLADVFQASGYRTALFGKWHLGATYPYRPMDRGFEEWLGQGDGGTATTDGYFFNDRVNDHYLHNGEWVQRDGWSTANFFDAAIDYIDDDIDDRPFFIYLATYIPHEPISIDSPDPIAEMRERLQGFPPQKEKVAPFLASIELMDGKVGDLLTALDSSGKADNTIVIFMTDNGTAFGENVYNANMRGRKASVYEGGHRVPFFIRWPDGGLAHGTDIDNLTAHIDVMPTLAEFVGLDAAGGIDFDGTSLAQLIRNPEAELPDRVLFVERQRVSNPDKWSNATGMYGKWRFVNNSELYDLEIDPSQTRNRIERHPELVDRFRREFDKYWERVTAEPHEAPYAVIGSPASPEVFLHPADWQITPGQVPWNHAMVAAGPSTSASWKTYVDRPGTYRFELRRWPREVDAAFSGIPAWEEDPADAWDERGAIEKMLYPGDAVALPVKQVGLRIGGFEETREIAEDQTHVIFDVSLEEGYADVHSSMLDADGQILASAYYVYVRRLD